jgi:hypothetical protein
MMVWLVVGGQTEVSLNSDFMELKKPMQDD